MGPSIYEIVYESRAISDGWPQGIPQDGWPQGISARQRPVAADVSYRQHLAAREIHRPARRRASVERKSVVDLESCHDGQRAASQRECSRCQAVDGIGSRIVLDLAAAEVDRDIVRHPWQNIARPVQGVAPTDAVASTVPTYGRETDT